MSQSKQALRTRIKSVQSTRKITKAMEMIANAKLFRQRNRMEANREYAQKLQDTVNEIVSSNQDLDNRYIKKKTSPRKFTIVFCSDLGLCGGYNQNVLKFARENLNKEDPCILVGTSLYRSMKEEGFNLLNEEAISSDRQTNLSIRELVERAVDQYDRNEVGVVQLLYTKFVNTMTFQPDLDEILPCEMTEKKVIEGEHAVTLFEPDADTILNDLIPMMIYDVAYSDWLETTTAEQGSRRMAMKTASDNADELSQELQLEYNKARQAAITQEITELIGGANAV